MYESIGPQQPAPLTLLFPPRAVALLDIFRALGEFEERYDVSILDELEARLAELLDPAAAKCVVSDALLLAFGLRRERAERLEFSELGSRRGTPDEYRLLALIGASAEGRPRTCRDRGDGARHRQFPAAFSACRRSRAAARTRRARPRFAGRTSSGPGGGGRASPGRAGAAETASSHRALTRPRQ